MTLSEEDVELEERRQAEAEFVASAYSPDEAWCESENDSSLQVNRRLSLPATSSHAEDAMVSAVLKLSMPREYPSKSPLEVSFVLEKDKSTGPPNLTKAAYNALPQLVESCRQLSKEMLGDEAVFAILSHADEWLQEKWPQHCKEMQQTLSSPAKNSENSGGKNAPQKSKNATQVLGRRLIYSHHIISKVKRANMKDLASHYQLTGYVKIGWPGIIIIEGPEESCQDFYEDIKVWAWKYLVVRGEQQETVTDKVAGNDVSSALDSLRRFSSFVEVSDMKIVAEHCREVGLEALFRTSMKVYDSNDNTDGDKEASSTNDAPYGAFVCVDHMNDGKSYRKWLRKTASDTGVFLLIKQCFPHLDFTKRPTIVVALIGDKGIVADFMKRWRTSRVDVDSKGKPCLERQMKMVFEGYLTDNFNLGAIDWDTSNADEHLNVDNEQLIALIKTFGAPDWMEACESLLSPL